MNPVARRTVISMIGTGAVMLAGCTGSTEGGDGGSGESEVLASGSTGQEKTWDFEFDAGTELSIEVTLHAGYYALGTVQRLADAEVLLDAETDTEGETVTDTGEITEPGTHRVYIQTGGGDKPADASIVLRRL